MFSQSNLKHYFFFISFSLASFCFHVQLLSFIDWTYMLYDGCWCCLIIEASKMKWIMIAIINAKACTTCQLAQFINQFSFGYNYLIKKKKKFFSDLFFNKNIIMLFFVFFFSFRFLATWNPTSNSIIIINNLIISISLLLFKFAYLYWLNTVLCNFLAVEKKTKTFSKQQQQQKLSSLLNHLDRV